MSLQFVNIPLASNTCYTTSVTSTPIGEFTFLSPSAVTLFSQDESWPCNSWSNSHYYLPNQLKTLAKDLSKIYEIDVAAINEGDYSFTIKNVPNGSDLLTTSFGPFLTTTSITSGVATTQTIKKFVTANNQVFFVNLDTGENYKYEQPSWTRATCVH